MYALRILVFTTYKIEIQSSAPFSIAQLYFLWRLLLFSEYVWLTTADGLVAHSGLDNENSVCALCMAQCSKIEKKMWLHDYLEG